jgi:hypothetical protein
MSYRRALAWVGVGALAGCLGGVLWGAVAGGPDSAIGTGLLCMCAATLAAAVVVTLLRRS